MNNILEEIIKMITIDNFSHVGNKTLFFVNMLLFAVIPSILSVGTIGVLAIDIPYILDYSIKGIFGFFSSVVFRWLWDKGVTKFNAYKKKKSKVITKK